MFWKLNDDADIEKPETIDIQVDYMHLQDLGSGSYTEFDHDSDIVDLYIDNEDLMNYRAGLIHSHHTMQAFFSGTDTEELHEKAENGLYLSLIVNNHMEPVCKLAWMGQMERKIETFKSWDLGKFLRKPKKQTRTEIANVFYEIEMEIEFHDDIAQVHDRYNELKEEESIAYMAKSVHKGVGGGNGQQHSLGFAHSAEAATRWEESEYNPKNHGTTPDKTKQLGESTLSFPEKLEKKGMLQNAFGAVLTQDPKTKCTLSSGLSEAMGELRLVVQALDDNNDLPDNQTFMEAYDKEAKEYGQNLIIAGDDILAEMLGEFYIDDDEYYLFLQRMYDLLSKESGILVKHLKNAIVALTMEDDDAPNADIIDI